MSSYGRRWEEVPLGDIVRELKEGFHQRTNPSVRLGGSHEGPWVVIGRVRNEGVPVLEPVKRIFLRRYATAEEAIAASVEHSSTRVGGGWALNLETGATVQIRRFDDGRVV